MLPAVTRTSFVAAASGCGQLCARAASDNANAKHQDYRAHDGMPQFGLGADLAGREFVIRAAELAGHGNLAVLDHVVAVVLRKALEHRFDIVARARTLARSSPP